jgi:hypothetical protein
LSFLYNGISSHIKCYWSERTDQADGRLKPFDSDHYVGSVPCLAGELHYDSKTSGSWGMSSSTIGGYAIDKVQWVPGMSNPLGTDWVPVPSPTPTP